MISKEAKHLTHGHSHTRAHTHKTPKIPGNNQDKPWVSVWLKLGLNRAIALPLFFCTTRSSNIPFIDLLYVSLLEIKFTTRLSDHICRTIIRNRSEKPSFAPIQLNWYYCPMTIYNLGIDWKRKPGDLDNFTVQQIRWIIGKREGGRNNYYQLFIFQV